MAATTAPRPPTPPFSWPGGISDSDITANSLAVNSPESITANVTIQTGAAIGFRDVTVTTNLGLDVSAAFFLSIEFKETGHLIFCFYRASFPDSPTRPRGFPRLDKFLRDVQEVGRGVVVRQGDWESLLASNKLASARRWMEREEFVSRYPAVMTGEQYVEAIFANAGITPTADERASALAAFGGQEGRARPARHRRPKERIKFQLLKPPNTNYQRARPRTQKAPMARLPQHRLEVIVLR